MTDSYQFQGGTFDPVEQVNVLPEQEKVNAKIERSESEYFDSLRQNDRNRAKDTEDLYRQLGKFAKSFEGLANEMHKKYVEQEEAQGAIDAMNSDYKADDIRALLEEENNMRRQDVELKRIGNDIENETGSFTLGDEVREMSGYRKYAFVKNILLREGQNYKKYKLTARNTASITVPDENGNDIKIGYGSEEDGFVRPPQNQAEADALDAKIRAEFSAQFGGVNPVLLQATIKPIVDEVDRADKAQRDSDFETAAKERDELNERQDLITNIESNPGNGRAAVEHYIEINKYKYNGDVSLTRMALADTLYDAVLKGELSITQALATVQFAIPHRGTKKDEDMTIFKEWKNLETRLMEANTQFREESEDFEKDKMLAEIEEFKKIQNPSIEDRAAFIRGFNSRYPGKAIPEEGLNIVYGYKDDDMMKQKLDRIKAKNDGYITEKDLEGASPEIINRYRGDIRPNGQEKISSVAELGDSAVKYVRNRTAESLDLLLGEGDTTSLEFDTLLRNVESEFVFAYNLSLAAERDPVKAKLMAEQHIIQLLGKDTWRDKNSTRTYTNDDLGRQKALQNAQKTIKPASGNWRVIKLDVPSEEKEELKQWAEGGGEGPVPSYYAGLAHINGIPPKVLASSQAALFGFNAPTIDEKKYTDIPPSVRHLLIYKPSPSKIEIAKKQLELEENKDKEEYVPAWKQKQNLREGV